MTTGDLGPQVRRHSGEEAAGGVASADPGPVIPGASGGLGQTFPSRGGSEPQLLRWQTRRRGSVLGREFSSLAA